MIEILIRNIMKFHNKLDASKGIRDRGLIESAVNTPFQTFGGQSLYPSVFDKAARLFFGLVRNHGFIDGNKRVALHATELFLNLNDYLLVCSQEERVDTTMRIAKNEMNDGEIKDWLITHSHSVKVQIFIHGTVKIG